MSTVPGDRSWRDAGLVEPALTDLPEVAPDAAHEVEDGAHDPEDVPPALHDEALRGEVAEQRAAVPDGGRDDHF